ncbi:hypothetical protein HHK36_001314 [Tetracentron sinense]|uniref:PCI domain-containing protein n=1 Tax=Tetracentron sinense TaxID=13715 RepID=A0A834ZXE3_TETSI|nr:hypothetical protein HHK36_001314 [Tetracentron sinense]
MAHVGASINVAPLVVSSDEAAFVFDAEAVDVVSLVIFPRSTVMLTEFKSLPPLFEESPDAVHELAIARDIYEHAVVLSVKTEDQDAFERDFFQLKPYYTDASSRLPPSPQEYPILGLNLLRLLVQNRIAEFHTELELLSSTALENTCIKHAVELEQSFMEGAYNRVLSARQTVPHETYVYFMDLLAKTVRDEIAGCSEKAYDYLSMNDARQMLMFTSDQELSEYITEVMLTEFKSLPPLFEESPDAVHELAIARDIYEHAVVLSVKTEDQDAFERDFFQLKPYYTDASSRLPPSPQEYPILGLNLLRLLVQNRIAEFHTELELLSSTALENTCIKHAVELEQSFMEGAYNRVLSARQTVPHETYVYFMDLLAKTVRDEIAGCSEKAYDYLSMNDARQMLMFTSDQELSEYITEEHPEWEMKNGVVFFQKAKESAPCKEIPSLQLINQTLSYARELERIV